MVVRSPIAFLGIFWLVRLVIQFFLFDARPYLTTTVLFVGFHALTVVFIYLTTVYAIAALAPHGV